MSPNQQVQGTPGKAPGRLSRWFQRRTTSRTAERIRRKGGSMMGMEVLVLHTRGRVSGQPRETPVAWFPDGDDSWLVVASGGGGRNPDWYTNLMAQPEQAAIEFHGSDPVTVTPEELSGSEREQAWEKVAELQPRIAKYQSKSNRLYPVIRLRTR